MAALLGANATLQGDINAEATARTAADIALQTQIDNIATVPQNLLDLANYVSVDPSTLNDLVGPHVIFTGANVHIRNGIGGNGSTNGLGNLIVGYNETSRVQCSGTAHTISSWANTTAIRRTVAWWSDIHNDISGPYASVSGGTNNTASGIAASVSGGRDNTASGIAASVSGGASNTASGPAASVSGGRDNLASSLYASVSGGFFNRASHDYASVSGGNNNQASGVFSAVSGGQQNLASGNSSTVSGGFSIEATLDYSHAP